MKYADELGISFLSSSFHLHLFGLLFNKECVRRYIIATDVHFLPPCICQLHVTFKKMIFSKKTSVLEGTFAEVFLPILGKSYISERLCRCR